MKKIIILILVVLLCGCGNKNTTIISLNKNLNIEVGESVYLYDLVNIENGSFITKNYLIDTNKIGTKDISFTYKASNNKNEKYSFKVNIIDTTPPVILSDTTYEIEKGKKFNIKRLDGLEALNKRLDFFKNNNERELYELTLKNYLVMLRKYYINVKKNIKSSHDIQKKLKKEYKEKTKTFFIVHNCSILEKLKVKFFIVAPNIYWIKFTIEQWTNNYKIRRKCNYGKKIS
mgnify:CR=1 FL=1